MRVFAGFVALSLLSGCAGSPVGDAIAGPEKLAQQDDEYCRSIGARPGTPNYTNCRLTVSQQRDARHANRLAIAGAAISSMAPPPAPPPRTCQSVQVGHVWQTVCQ